MIYDSLPALSRPFGASATVARHRAAPLTARSPGRGSVAAHHPRIELPRIALRSSRATLAQELLGDDIKAFSLFTCRRVGGKALKVGPKHCLQLG
ncbi:hypothetical protein ABIF29_003008 [Bradyrhizobium elkanii]|uniref:Uncharacterized protein n=1 Tax=Bradyrhizobium elkanii TaxID=29448 RepID=A0ABV4EYG4_BRAEL